MKHLRTLLLLSLLLAAFVSSAQAQDAPYLFSVQRESVMAYWNEDGTLSLDYEWLFINDPSAHAIDFVDVGMPNASYNIANVSADVNGAPVSISRSDYQGSGVGFAIVLGAQAIPPGGSGSVHVYIANIPEVLYPDDSDSNYASAVFAPTYFGSQYVQGATDLTITFLLPPNMAENEPRWHAAPAGFPETPQSFYDSENRVNYVWNSPTASVAEQYSFGASFPASYVPEDAIVRFSFFDFIIGAIASLFSFIASSLPCLIFAAIFLGSPILSAIQAQRRKMKYLPPKVAIEGHGIKRGLTAVESAILLEQPLDKVMTMILFSVIKKNAASVTTRNPLELEIHAPQPDGLHPYEIDFLSAFKFPNKRDRQEAMQNTMVSLVKSVGEKMRGFSGKETREYYKSIMEKAWQMVESADTPEVKSQKFEEALEWTMLDDDYDDRTRRTFQQPIFVPHWWGRYDPTYRPAAPRAASSAPVSAPSSGGKQGLPGADFAASVVTGVQTFSSNVVGNINTFTEKITGKTNPIPVVKSSGGGGGGGRSCACACACAGCACACAGGGR